MVIGSRNNVPGVLFFVQLPGGVLFVYAQHVRYQSRIFIDYTGTTNSPHKKRKMSDHHLQQTQ
jgi:hypothetical protein